MNDKGKQYWVWWLLGFIVSNYIIRYFLPNITGLAISLILFGIYLIIIAFLLSKYKGIKLFRFVQNYSAKGARNYALFYKILGIVLILIGVSILI